jgi:nicotinamidase-related amidase/type 1 glutamine amidotransferase
MFNRFTASLAVAVCLVGMPLCHSAELNLQLRSRVETAADSGRYHSITTPETWQADQTAVVVCDMWDKHWCPAATARVAEMAPEMNKVIAAARAQGALIIHCPSDTLDFYKDTPQRKRAQAAPVVETKIPLSRWCHLDKSVEGNSLPIDDSDGGCDSDQPVKNYRAWSRQHPAIEIAEQDAITDSAEAYYLMQQQGIKNVVVMGVHTNMCVLGRPFGIRQLVQQGMRVALMRDMTDTMYNPAKAPFVSHFTGTDLVIQHIEQYWCPTILSTDFVQGREFRFIKDTRPHLVVLCAEQEYRTHESLSAFAKQHLGHNFRVSFVWDDAQDRNSLPGIDVVAQADLLLISVRRRTLPASQLQFVRDLISAGKPVLGIRTASHAFCLRNQEPADGLENWTEFDRQVFGGSYTNHHGAGPKTTIAVSNSTSKAAHAILQNLKVQDLVGNGSLYKVRPLADSAIPVLTGTIPDAEPEPIAWVYPRQDGGTSFYTSLGHIQDFANPEFQKLLKQALLWLAAKPTLTP